MFGCVRDLARGRALSEYQLVEGKPAMVYNCRLARLTEVTVQVMIHVLNTVKEAVMVIVEPLPNSAILESGH